MELSAPNRPPLERSVPLTTATPGTPDGARPDAIMPISWDIGISNVTSGTIVTATARGKRGGSLMVTAAANVILSPGGRVTVVLRLDAVCQAVTCGEGQSCARAGAVGTCQLIPIIGAPDGGGDAGDGRLDGGDAGPGIAGAGGRGGTGGRGGSGVGGAPSGGSGGGGAPGGASGEGGSGGGPPPKIANGGPCATGTDCMSTFCVDGVCCNTSCNMPCMACTLALTGSSADGTCAAVVSGQNDPRSMCDATPATGCGTTGRCDGAGACELHGTSTVCLAAACANGSFTAASTCNGRGTCTPGASNNCQGAVCAVTTGCATSCTSDAGCTGGYCTAAMTCAAKKTNGATCAAANECTSNNCVGNICCETACTGLCMSCSMTDTTQASGLCRPISAGRPSNGRCTRATATCGLDGTCDGTGMCRNAPNTTSCGAAACAGSQLTGMSMCNGVGACMAPAAMACAGGFGCGSATACRTSCTAEADCATGNYCAGTMCMPKKGNGGACAAGAECTSASCVGGLCCENACAGACMACAMTVTGMANGLCRPVPAGGSSAGRCTPAAPCGLDGMCDGAGACRNAPATTACGTTACSGNTRTTGGTCTGSGTCGAGTTGPCPGNFTCASATACRTTCAAPSDCVATAYCANGACMPKKSNGTACGTAGECTSNICSPDGVCCNLACTGSCQACDNPGSVGTCSPVLSGNPHGNRALCAGTAPCAGTCTGRSDGQCSFPTTTCGTATCSGTQLVPAGTCNGAGACVTPAAQTCANGYACSGAACRTSCTASSDCRSDFFCAANACHNDVVSMTTAATHTCAALADGRAYCWGSNLHGQIGDGTTTDTSTPIRVAGLSTATKVVSGARHNCALTSGGGVVCWGYNGEGQIGNGSPVDELSRPTPVPVVLSTGGNLTGVTRLVAGYYSNCATTASTFYCWGDNGESLGVDAYSGATPLDARSAKPVLAGGLPSVFSANLQQIASFNGVTICSWGATNSFTEISASCTPDVCVSPTSNCFQPVGGNPINQVSAGPQYGCVRYGVNVRCWGSNTYGTLNPMDVSVASLPPNPGNVVNVSPGAVDLQTYEQHVCVILGDSGSTMKCWGNPYTWSVGRPSSYIAPVTVPTAFPAGVRPASLAPGGTSATTCLIATDGSPWCFGDNIQGEIGNGQTGSNTWVQTPISPTIVW